MATRRFVKIGLFLALNAGCGFAQTEPIKPVPFTAVHVTDGFWAPRIKRNHDVTIPIALNQCYATGRVDNFLIAGKQKEGKFRTEFPFDDTDIYKIIEGASYSLQTFPDPRLEARIDTLIEYIGKAQEPDGYLYTSRTIDPAHPHPWAGLKRWEKDPDGSHELYNCGHLFEAAVAHFQSTGKRTLLDIALKNADLLCRDFGPGKLAIYPGHQIVEMGLVKLYRLTGERKYLDLAKYFLDVRGHGIEYNQSHLPVVKQTEAVGHAVRATYMYSGMADAAALTGDSAYVQAIDAIWRDLVSRKLYLTGGIGAAAGNEGFAVPYALPNMPAYCETCASIGNVYWNYRLFLLHGDSRYYDVLERTLYNALLSGVSLSGDRFFYPNPLESRGQHERSAWFGCACCPSNVCRFIPSVPGYVYATAGKRLFVNLFVQSDSRIVLDGNPVDIRQTTDYPWNGEVRFSVVPEESREFELAVRIPGWVIGDAVPGDLYRFADAGNAPYHLSINGEPVSPKLENGYAVIGRKWKPGDRVQLSLPMPVQRVHANQYVSADTGRVALQRGPLVYCLEWPDVKEGHPLNLVLDSAVSLRSEYRSDLLGGIQTISGRAENIERAADGDLVKKTADFTAIPYHAWANRGPGEMTVWIAETPSSVWLPKPTIASTSRILASHETRDLFALNDRTEPASSNDSGVMKYDWWPFKDTLQWVEYRFAKPETVTSVKVYWFDDGPWGGCRVPRSWTISYRDSSGTWKTVAAKDSYAVEKDRLNVVRFEPVRTDALKLDVRLAKDHSGGLLEWIVE